MEVAYGSASWCQGQLSPYYKESHAKLRAMVRKIVDEELTPYVHDWDEAGEIPASFRKKAYATGMAVLACGKPFAFDYGPPLPAFLSRDEVDIFHTIVVFQEMARAGSIGVGWGIGAGLCIGLPPVLTFGSEELKHRVAPSVLSGDKVICLAVTEPSGGSDVSALRGTAELSNCGTYFTVNAVRKWITNGIFSDYITLLVRTGGEGMNGLSLMLVDSKSAGIKMQKMKCSGVWCSGTTLISFDNVQVPATNLIGKLNKGFKYIVHNFNYERIIICAQAIGSARACFEEAWNHSHKRKTFGKLLAEHQMVRFKLAEMARQIEGCQAWLESLAFQLHTMHPKEADLKLGGPTALLKVHCTKVLELCARESAQIFGGLSYTRGGLGEKVERVNREVRALAIPGGSEEIMIDLGVRMTTKVAEIGATFVSNTDPGMQKKLAMAKRVGVNVDVFGDGSPFGDPSWYLSFNSALYNGSHRALRSFVRAALVGDFATSGLAAVAAGTRPQIPSLTGVKVDLFHELIIIDELARGKSYADCVRLWNSVAGPAALLRATAASDSLIESLATGAVRIATAIAEEESSGHDLRNLRTVATSGNGEYFVTGRKWYVTNAAGAHQFIVAAAHDAGLSLFLVSKGPGVDVVGFETTGDLSAAHVTFTAAKGQLLGELGKAREYLQAAEGKEQWTAAIQAVRFARVSFEEALKRTQSREAFGKPLMSHQALRWKLGEMARHIESAFCYIEMLTYHLACGGSWTALRGKVMLAKVNATKAFEYCNRESGQIIGAEATVRRGAVERLSRDVRALALVAGSEEVLLDQAIQIAESKPVTTAKTNILMASL